MRFALLAGTLAAALSLLVAPVARADDNTITVLAGRAAQDLLNEMHPALEKATGHKIELIWANATSVRKRMASGESYDVVIIVQPDIDLFIKHHQLAAGSRTDLMKTSVAVAVRQGAPHPDISSADAVKRTLLAAKSIGYSSGTSGEYVVLMVEKLSIKDQVFSKMVQVGQGVRVAGLLAKREVELGLQQASELINEPGIDYLGPLPAELQKTSTYSAGIGAASKHPDAARALIKALMSPEAVEVMKKHGLEPG
jgi:molybdate transport system substrate-binding protein